MARTKNAKDTRSNEELNDTGEFNQEQTNAEAKDSTASRRKKAKLAQDSSYIEIPDVSDIPGQEHITNAGVPAAMGDTTAASDDEEGIRDGKDIFEEGDDEVEIVMGTDADVTPEDLAMLGEKDQDMDMNEDEFIRKEGLDDTDLDGDPLNEAAVSEDSTGDDLDMPDENDQDLKKPIDDEENDYYSFGSGDNDALNEGRRDDEEK
ncbi:hypothetical protein [Longitalea arenae]|uniref:hypothetical protein n=1 Tax=Longitalea arenae TaxID=2812558 RepID=UPI001967B940|nr:hypothetical protein [Longitalea arenae]